MDTDTLINIAYQNLMKVRFRYVNGVNLYYCERELYAAELNCAGEEAYVFVRAKSPFEAAEKIKKMVNRNEKTVNN